jgi:predicted helicase
MPRREVMNHMKHDNISLLFNKREELPVPYAHFLVTDKMAEHSAVSIKTICYQAPLYLFQGSTRKANVNPDILKKLSFVYKRGVTPEEVFYYVYAVGHSPTYRSKFNNELRQDFPRIPFAEDAEKFDAMVSLGKNLTELHLGKSILNTQTKFDIPGSNVVEKIEYSLGKITINKSQYFENVPLELWQFRIGAYQVLEKWLKSRKGRKLDGSEIECFINIIEIIRNTMSIMKLIDAIPFLTDN